MTSENRPDPHAEVTLRVDGEPRTLLVDHRRVPLDPLRADLGPTGSRKGCDHGGRGACTALDARTARSRFVGGTTMGLGMALTEGSTMDARFGDFTEAGLASCHVPAHADVPGIAAHGIEEGDPHLDATDGMEVAETGAVGTAAALGDAVHHATGIRFREPPLTPDRILTGLLSER
ncbi:hypothetical protein [Streptomyces sp. NPDC059168]|uniref:hypothetical protein n=1 Tax=Streptomyces sp. NPDC059168 TaxID=3346753 RepID=UPI0036C638FF